MSLSDSETYSSERGIAHDEYSGVMDAGCGAPGGRMLRGFAMPMARMAKMCCVVPPPPRPEQSYEKPAKTMESVETTYYHVATPTSSLVPFNEFWLDFAKHVHEHPSENFVSGFFPIASGSINELLLMLGALGVRAKEDCSEGYLRVQSGVEGGVELTQIDCEENVMVFATSRVSVPAGETKLMILEKFYDPFDKHDQYAGQLIRKFWSRPEYESGKIYGLTVYATNVTELPIEMRLLAEPPEGSIVIAPSGESRASVVVPAHSVRVMDLFLFYFPAEGGFRCYPVQACASSLPELLGFGDRTQITVRRPSSTPEYDSHSWLDVAVHGTDQEVLDFLRANGVYGQRLDAIYFRLKSPQFFKALQELLHPFYDVDRTILSYSLFHKDWSLIPEYLRTDPQVTRSLLPYCRFHNVTWDALDQAKLLYKEYESFIEIRSHGSRSSGVPSPEIRQTLTEFFLYVSCKPAPDSRDRLIYVYYLFLLNRYTEGEAYFAKHLVASRDAAQGGRPQPPADLGDCRLQYDSVAAFLDCLNSEPKYSKAIVAEYNDYPVKRWRDFFLGLENLFTPSISIVNEESREHRQAYLATKSSSVSLELEGRNVCVISYKNCTSCRLNYYMISLELLFSYRSTMEYDSGFFRSVQPNVSKDLSLPSGQSQISVPIEAPYSSEYMLVEVVSGSKRALMTFAPCQFQVHLSEEMGLLQVVGEDQRELSRAYVKVYGTQKGSSSGTLFYKDGYTDLRGRFDYVSVSSGDIDKVSGFSIFVSVEGLGCKILKARLPNM